MFLFLIKKTFYDLWDHLINIIILNIGFLVIFVFDYFIFILSHKLLISLHFPILLFYLITYIVFLLMIMLIFIYSGAASSILKDIADYQGAEMKNFFFILL